MTAARRPRLLTTVGWFLLGFVWLWLVSVFVDAALSSLVGVSDVLARSSWARAVFLFCAAFAAAVAAITVARRHTSWGAETMRAAWVVGAIDLALGIAALAGAGEANPATSIAEGAGFIAAAALFAVFSAPRRPAEPAEPTT